MKIVAYYRVSTKRQAASGLGLDAQREAVAQFARANNLTIEKEFKERESGKNSARPVLQKAIDYAENIKGRLVIAKLDRLYRNVAATSALMESGVDFVCCDNPNANRLTIHILAAVAENESRAISTRTKEALAAAKARGVKLGARNRKFQARVPADWRERGTENGLKKAQAASVQKRKRDHAKLSNMLTDDIKAWRKEGLSYAKIAARLTEQGRHTCEGESKFHANTVRRLLLLK